MRVLVTGSAGFIGYWVQQELQDRGHTVLHFDAGDNICNTGTVQSAVAVCDAVINLAGALGTSELMGREHGAAEVNILGAINVYNAAARAGVPVVQIGTGHKGQPNPYAITKGCAEDLGLARAQWQGEKISVVRVYHAYGAFQKPCPPHGSSSVRKFLPSFICRALTGQPLEIFGDTQYIDPVHASLAARVLIDAIDGPYGQVTEAGCGIPVTVDRIAEEVAVACQSESQIVHTAPRQGEPEGSIVVAAVPAPACAANPWPYLLHATIEHYRRVLAGVLV